MSRSQPSNFRNETITDTSFVMPFGKYKGMTIADLLEHDPYYLFWISENTSLDLDHSILDDIGVSFEEAARNAKLKY